MPEVIIRHLPETEPPLFNVEGMRCRLAMAKSLPPADTFPVEDRPRSHLVEELRWYLEELLDYPFSPATERAEKVLASLRAWGRESFTTLLGTVPLESIEDLRIVIESESSRVLSWPWEALNSPQIGPLGQQAVVTRRLPDLQSPAPLSSALPGDCLEVLLVTARPDQADESTYRSIALPLAELESQGLPIRVHLLRPPSLEKLTERLRERRWHVLHFDVHGDYGDHLGTHHESHLHLEDGNGNLQFLASSTLRRIFRRNPVPIVVLNACQSATLATRSKNVYASVAATLLSAGARSVVAMAYVLYRSAAEIFVPAFYRQLVTHGDVADALRAGRLAMSKQPERLSQRGRFALEDWLIPVLYESSAAKLRLGSRAPSYPNTAANRRVSEVDPRSQGFVGRDRDILHLDRALNKPEGTVLIHGLSGVGKTSLARSFLAWLKATHWTEAEGVWLSFQDVLTVEAVVQHLGMELGGPRFQLLDPEETAKRLTELLRYRCHLVVWDNFETARDRLAESDLHRLREFLQDLEGGASKVLITSCDREEWLGGVHSVLGLEGLDDEGRWRLGDQILVESQNILNRRDPEVALLMDYLAGHPLAMRIVLPELYRRNAMDLLTDLQSDPRRIADYESSVGNEVFSVLRLAEESLAPELRSLLVPLALHEKFVDAQFLDAMNKKADIDLGAEEIDRFLACLNQAGLLRWRASTLYDLHPALTGYLRSSFLPRISHEELERWARIFTSMMGDFAYTLAPLPPHHQLGAVRLNQASFLSALRWARELGMVRDQIALLNCLGVQAYHLRAFAEATHAFEALVELCYEHEDYVNFAVSLHWLGMIAQEQRDFATAESWFRRSLEVERAAENDARAAAALHHLGMLAHEQNRLDEAREHFQESLELFTQAGEPSHAAASRLHLGMLAQERGNIGNAHQNYQEALRIAKETGDERLQASSLHQLSVTSFHLGRLDEGLRFGRHALILKQKLGGDQSIASTHHHLGVIHEAKGELDEAEKSFLKSLQTTEEQGSGHIASKAYHHLGCVAHDKKDFASAEKWTRKALRIEEEMEDETGAAASYHLLGLIMENTGLLEEAERCYKKSIEFKKKLGLKLDQAVTWYRLGRIAECREMWRLAAKLYYRALEIEDRFGEEVAATTTCLYLGRALEELGQLNEAEGYYKKALELADKYQIEAYSAASCLALDFLQSRRESRHEALVWICRALQHAIRGEEVEEVEFAELCYARLRDHYRALGDKERGVIREILTEAELAAVWERLEDESSATEDDQI